VTRDHSKNFPLFETGRLIKEDWHIKNRFVCHYPTQLETLNSGHRGQECKGERRRAGWKTLQLFVHCGVLQNVYSDLGVRKADRLAHALGVTSSFDKGCNFKGTT
jgi:hypothetical protein